MRLTLTGNSCQLGVSGEREYFAVPSNTVILAIIPGQTSTLGTYFKPRLHVLVNAGLWLMERSKLHLNISVFQFIQSCIQHIQIHKSVIRIPKLNYHFKAKTHI